MINLKDKVVENPIKFFILTLIGIFIFLFIVFIITLDISYKPTINTVSSFFIKTNVSTTLDFFISSSVNNSINPVDSSTNSLFSSFNFNSVSSLLALIGSLGFFSYFFYSIKEGTLSKTDNKKILYGFFGFMIIIFLFIAIVFVSSFQAKFPIEKQYEIIGLFIFLFFTALIAALFKNVNDEIEENYENRTKIIDFLEIKNPKVVFWQPIDNFSRYIVLNNDFFSTFVFILIYLIPISGILIGLNLISIIFIEIMIFAIFSAFCRLIKLCEGYSNITLNHQLYSREYSFSSEDLSKVFFLPNLEDSYFKILTKKGYITILKNEVITIHDIDVIIFKEKGKLLPLNIWIKRIVRFVLSAVAAYIFYLVLLFVTVYIAIFIYPNLQQISPESMSLLLATIQGLSVVSVFCLIGLYRKKIDKWLEIRVDRLIVPSPFEYF